MLRYVLRRVLWAIPTLLFITFLVYVALRTGTDPVKSYLRINPRATKAKIAQYIEVNGLDPNYVRGYWSWLRNFVTGNWPRSIKGRSLVWPPLRYSLFNTLRLAGIATIVGIGLGLLVGIVASLRPGGVLDTFINTSAFIAGSIQPFVSGVILQLVFAVEPGWLPPDRKSTRLNSSHRT